MTSNKCVTDAAEISLPYPYNYCSELALMLSIFLMSIFGTALLASMFVDADSDAAASEDSGREPDSPDQLESAVVGTDADDLIVLRSQGEDIAFGGEGNDTLRGGADTQLFGGQDDDLLLGVGDTAMFGNEGNDILHRTTFASNETSAPSSMTGGSGSDIFSVYLGGIDTTPAEGPDAPPPAPAFIAEITDFQPGVDKIAIQTALQSGWVESYEILPSEDGTFVDLSLTIAPDTYNGASANGPSAEGAPTTAFVRIEGVSDLDPSDILFQLSSSEMDEGYFPLVEGTPEADILTRNTSAALFTAEGNDVVQVRGEHIYGSLGSGDDTIDAQGDIVLIHAGEGNDVVHLNAAANPSGFSSYDFGTFSNVVLGEGDDTLTVESGEVRVGTGLGADTVVLGPDANAGSIVNLQGAGDHAEVGMGVTVNAMFVPDVTVEINAYPEHLLDRSATIVELDGSELTDRSSTDPAAITLNLPPEVTGDLTIRASEVETSGNLLLPQFEIVSESGQTLLTLRLWSSMSLDTNILDLITINRDVALS